MQLPNLAPGCLTAGVIAGLGAVTASMKRRAGIEQKDRKRCRPSRLKSYSPVPVPFLFLVSSLGRRGKLEAS